jgi:tRNA A58 N-methylase Trm61
LFETFKLTNEKKENMNKIDLGSFNVIRRRREREKERKRERERERERMSLLVFMKKSRNFGQRFNSDNK